MAVRRMGGLATDRFAIEFFGGRGVVRPIYPNQAVGPAVTRPLLVGDADRTRTAGGGFGLQGKYALFERESRQFCASAVFLLRVPQSLPER
jgi:hypothetical protein